MPTTTSPQRYTTVTLAPRTGDALFGGTSNPYYEEPQRRRMTARIVSNDRGQHFASLLVGREWAPNQFVWDNSVLHSPLYDAEDDAVRWADETLRWAAVHYTGQHTADGPAQPPTADPAWPSYRGHTVCQQCGAFDTITLKQEAWADVFTCGDCGHSDRYSIPD